MTHFLEEKKTKTLSGTLETNIFQKRNNFKVFGSMKLKVYMVIFRPFGLPALIFFYD